MPNSLEILSEIEQLLKKYKLWYQVEKVYKGKGLDAIKIKEISIKTKT